MAGRQGEENALKRNFGDSRQIWGSDNLHYGFCDGALILAAIMERDENDDFDDEFYDYFIDEWMDTWVD